MADGFLFDSATPTESPNVTASTDAAKDLCVGFTVGPVASVGQIRVATGGIDGAGFEMWARRGDDSGDFLVVGAYAQSGDYGDAITFGGYGFAADAPALMTTFVNVTWAVALTTSTPEGDVIGASLDEYDVDGPIAGFKRRAFAFERHTNILFFGRSNIVTEDNVENFLAGGEGVIARGYAEVNPTTDPVDAITEFVDASDGEAYYVNANGDTRAAYGGGNVLPFTFGADADESISAVDSIQNDALLVRSGVISAPRTITWSKPPRTSSRVYVRNQNAESVNVRFSSGGGVAIAPGAWAIVAGDGADAFALASGT